LQPLCIFSGLEAHALQGIGVRAVQDAGAGLPALLWSLVEGAMPVGPIHNVAEGFPLHSNVSFTYNHVSETLPRTHSQIKNLDACVNDDDDDKKTKVMMIMIYTFPIRRSGVCIDQTVNKIPPLSSILKQCLPCCKGRSLVVQI